MEVDTLREGDVAAFVDELWLPAQREMAAASEYALAEDVRADGLAHRRSRLADDDAVTYVARGDDGRLGYVAAEVSTPPPIFEPVRECHVEALFVREDARRQGVASALLDAAEAWARNRGCDRMDLSVHRGNRGARRLYEAAGYEVRRHDMQKPLPDGE